MAKPPYVSRRQAEDDSEPDDQISGVLAKLALADLGNESRDRLTAHDKERDRDRAVDQGMINRVRRCNGENNPEAEVAAEKSQQLNAWNSMGVTREGDLAPIANGQYHRVATTARVQDEKFRTGNETGESSRARGRGGPSANDRGRGTSRATAISRSSAVANRPLDPAVDPDRVYTYKTGSRYNHEGAGPTHDQAVRGGHSAVRGGHSTTPLRNDPSKAPASTSAFARPQPVVFTGQSANQTEGKGGLNNRAAVQRKAQKASQKSGPVWPPPGLDLGKIAEIETLHRAAASTPSLSSLSIPELDTRFISKSDSAIVPEVQPATQVSKPVFSGVKPVQSKPTAPVKVAPTAKWQRTLDNPDLFFSAIETSQPKVAPAPAPAPVASRPKLSTTDVVTISRSELRQPASTTLPVPKDDHTDGLPSPAVLSDLVTSPDLDSVFTTSDLFGLGVSNIGTEQPVDSNLRSSQQASPVQDLLTDNDDEAQMIKEEPLTPFIPEDFVMIHGVRYVREDSKSITVSKEDRPAVPIGSSQLPPLAVHGISLQNPVVLQAQKDLSLHQFKQVKQVNNITVPAVESGRSIEYAAETKSEPPSQKVLPLRAEMGVQTWSPHGQSHTHSDSTSLLGHGNTRPVVKVDQSRGLYTSRYADNSVGSHHNYKQSLSNMPQLVAWLPEKFELENLGVVTNRNPGEISLKPLAAINVNISQYGQQARETVEQPHSTSTGSLLFPNANRHRSDSSDGSEL